MFEINVFVKFILNSLEIILFCQTYPKLFQNYHFSQISPKLTRNFLSHLSETNFKLSFSVKFIWNSFKIILFCKTYPDFHFLLKNCPIIIHFGLNFQSYPFLSKTCHTQIFQGDTFCMEKIVTVAILIFFSKILSRQLHKLHKFVRFVDEILADS